MKKIATLSLLTMLTITHVYAEDTTVSTTVQAPNATPASTATWLELQRSGSQASAQAQPLSAPVMNKIHERYVNSFAHPIPEKFKREEQR